MPAVMRLGSTTMLEGDNDLTVADSCPADSLQRELALIAGDAAIDAAKSQLMAIQMEDIPTCERVQAGLQSADAMAGPLSNVEIGERHRAFSKPGAMKAQTLLT